MRLVLGGRDAARPGGEGKKDKFFGYRRYKSGAKYQKALAKLFKKGIIEKIQKGLSASVYTELSDVEDEANGFLTYDRRVLKVDKEFMQRINKSVYNVAAACQMSNCLPEE